MQQFRALRTWRTTSVLVGGAIVATVASAPALAQNPSAVALGAYMEQRLSSPPRTVVTSSSGAWLATFTDGAQSVTLSGPTRTFAEPATTAATVSTSIWVRLLGKPFAGAVDRTWLSNALADTTPDVLAIAMQYVRGAPPRLTSTGLKIAGDASYGPLQSNGTRSPGSDFNDYLGVAWKYPSGTVDKPEVDEAGALDCSGFVRMVFGYRGGIALSLLPDGGASLPRHSWAIAASAPGREIIGNFGMPTLSRSKLQAGDIVAFDASPGDGGRIDHVGVFLGRDSLGHDRFISSRRTANGPTMGDLGGQSTLDGSGLFATAFRGARRL